jgi:hypothetical protein
MSYLDLFHPVTGLPKATNGLTSAHYNALNSLVAAGGRGGFYLAYYEMLKQMNPAVVPGG